LLTTHEEPDVLVLGLIQEARRLGILDLVILGHQEPLFVDVEPSLRPRLCIVVRLLRKEEVQVVIGEGVLDSGEDLLEGLHCKDEVVIHVVVSLILVLVLFLRGISVEVNLDEVGQDVVGLADGEDWAVVHVLVEPTLVVPDLDQVLLASVVLEQLGTLDFETDHHVVVARGALMGEDLVHLEDFGEVNRGGNALKVVIGVGGQVFVAQQHVCGSEGAQVLIYLQVPINFGRGVLDGGRADEW
jgi:hypothetical protein